MLIEEKSVWAILVRILNSFMTNVIRRTLIFNWINTIIASTFNIFWPITNFAIEQETIGTILIWKLKSIRTHKVSITLTWNRVDPIWTIISYIFTTSKAIFVAEFQVSFAISCTFVWRSIS